MIESTYTDHLGRTLTVAAASNTKLVVLKIEDPDDGATAFAIPLTAVQAVTSALNAAAWHVAAAPFIADESAAQTGPVADGWAAGRRLARTFDVPAGQLARKIQLFDRTVIGWWDMTPAGTTVYVLRDGTFGGPFHSNRAAIDHAKSEARSGE